MKIIFVLACALALGCSDDGTYTPEDRAEDCVNDAGVLSLDPNHPAQSCDAGAD